LKRKTGCVSAAEWRYDSFSTILLSLQVRHLRPFKMLIEIFSWSLIAIAVVLSTIILASIWLFTPPWSFPRNIPTIPFYYALLPLFKDVDQEELYREYLEKPLKEHGAAKIFFAGQWNILIARPSYLAEVFRWEDTYPKTGNQIKIPHSVVAQYTGENIISAHGANWKLYTSIMKAPLQQDQDPAHILSNTRLLIDLFLQDQKKSSTGSVTVPFLFQRFSLANLSEMLFGSSFGVSINMI
jgi:hypothetical protein